MSTKYLKIPNRRIASKWDPLAQRSPSDCLDQLVTEVAEFKKHLEDTHISEEDDVLFVPEWMETSALRLLTTVGAIHDSLRRVCYDD